MMINLAVVSMLMILLVRTLASFALDCRRVHFPSALYSFVCSFYLPEVVFYCEVMTEYVVSWSPVQWLSIQLWLHNYVLSFCYIIRRLNDSSFDMAHYFFKKLFH